MRDYYQSYRFAKSASMVYAAHLEPIKAKLNFFAVSF